MTEASNAPLSQRVYRVDKFAVPEPAREEFLRRVRATHDLLRRQPGFIQDFLLEQSTGPGEFNFVTIAEWENADVIEPVRAAVASLHRSMNFNPQEMFARLSIKADLGNYQRVDA